jgi:signal transduction histidine kinase
VSDLRSGANLVWLVGGETALAAMWAAWLLFTLLFPRPVAGARARWLVAGCAAAVALVYGGYVGFVLAAGSSPGVEGRRLVAVSLAPGYVLPPAIVAVVLVRFWRRRGTTEGRYLGFLLGAFALGGGLYFLLWQVPVALGRTPVVGWELLPLAFTPCPAVLGAAVLRYGLFDVKAVAFRSLVYAALTAVVVAGYIGLATTLGMLITRNPVVPPLVATVVLAVAFQPVQDRLRRGISRLLYGSRDEPYAALSRLGVQLENVAAADALLPTLARTVAGALRLPYAAVELCQVDGTVLRRAAVGARPDGCVVLPAVAGGDLVGRLVVAPASEGTSFADSELRLLTDLVRHAAPALNALRLAAELGQSQQRVVRAAAEERQRVQRDLHDGIGPSLAGLTLRVGAARVQLGEDDLSGVASALADVEQRLGDCTAEVRRLLLRLRSPLLDSLGLAGALRHQAEQLTAGSLQMIVTAPAALADLPAAVEEAALAIATEAMTNVVRHAGATRCQTDVAVRPGPVRPGLELTVRDDGRGIPAQAAEGIGIRSMRQRAAELGGTFAVSGQRGAGTTVRICLPTDAP